MLLVLPCFHILNLFIESLVETTPLESERQNFRQGGPVWVHKKYSKINVLQLYVYIWMCVCGYVMSNSSMVRGELGVII